jgi:decaprenylphospho-beta-D-erythro-pentofuranosid-2-ulose 2-reductase
MKRILIMGAASAIAEATARVFAARGDALFLVARDAQRLAAMADDLKVRGAAMAETFVLDARDIDQYPQLVSGAAERLGGLDAALIAHGALSDQAACEQSVAMLQDQFMINAFSVMALCTDLANRFETQGHGVIAVISSVAGDRGKQSNYVYGAAKATVTAFTSGLRQRLYSKGVHVVTIKPGPIDTPMTAGMRRGLLWGETGTVATAIVRAMDRGTPVLYTPWFWQPIMGIIKAVPEFLFRRLRL